MKPVDEIIYDAIRADAELMEAIAYTNDVGDTVYPVISTCFEVSPTEKDNTPLPNIIVTDDGFQNQQTTKDALWEASEDRVQVGVDVAAESPREVQQLIRMVRRAIERYVAQMYTQGESIPELEQLSSDGLAWDWMRPCYYQRLTYQCITNVDQDNE